MKIENEEVRIKTGSEVSNLKAERVEIILNSEPFRGDEVSAGGPGSLRTGRPGLRKPIRQSSSKAREPARRQRVLEPGKSIQATRLSIAIETKVSTRFYEVRHLGCD